MFVPKGAYYAAGPARESGEAGGNVALRVNDVTAAVEDEFVVSANGVYVDHRTAE